MKRRTLACPKCGARVPVTPSEAQREAHRRYEEANREERNRARAEARRQKRREG